MLENLLKINNQNKYLKRIVYVGSDSDGQFISIYLVKTANFNLDGFKMVKIVFAGDVLTSTHNTVGVPSITCYYPWRSSRPYRIHVSVA